MAAKDQQLSDEEQDELISQYNSGDKKKWRTKVTKLIRDNPQEYKLLDLKSKSDANATHLTNQQFKDALPTLKSELIDCIFSDIDNIDDVQGDGKLKLTTITRWVNNKKLAKKRIIIKDENWLFEKLKSFQFTDLDADEGGTIDREEIHEHFDKEGVDPEVTDVIFDVIDANGDGDISIREWFQWQQKFRKKDLTKLFQYKTEKQEDKYGKIEEEELSTIIYIYYIIFCNS